MATHPSVDTNLKTDSQRDPDPRRMSRSSRQEDGNENLPFRAEPRVAPVAIIPMAVADQPVAQKLRRMMTREQGHALEMIGHAVDYLNDCYLFQGDDEEVINVGGSHTEALQILVSARWQILHSLPLEQPRMHNLWHALFRRASRRTSPHRNGSESDAVSVVTLSSSR